MEVFLFFCAAFIGVAILKSIKTSGDYYSDDQDKRNDEMYDHHKLNHWDDMSETDLLSMNYQESPLESSSHDAQ
jgi:hypothetical protein